ncbi:chromosome segregation protein SMC [Thalassotalea piscium]
MRLKHIKLAGFKSFVDQTKVSFEHDMTAIVGPNGCGKSNIIDAVRWVLGESSAKNLRGDAMTDVIFNGANSRKAIGQASVELVFDNKSGRLQGSMADRNEVSIRRVVNRDSQNTYYLNGSKCRRRDITDIFLGTGLGPRSYAIIEQGTISRLIESKPQELRIFIEEAAGISKYKERRRDTENRIRHTRENLERLTDIRFELGQQIEHLHQQAEAATRFKTLKTQERKYKAELAYLKWHKFNQQSQEIQSKYQKVAEQIDQHELKQKDQSFGFVATKQKLKSANEALQNQQQQKLQLAQKIAAAEQRIKHFQQQQQKIKTDQAHSQQQLSNAQEALVEAQKNLAQYREQLNIFQPKHQVVIEQIKDKQQALEEKSAEQQQVQTAWQLLLREQQANNQQQLADNKKLQQHESRIDYLQEQLAASNERLTQVKQQVALVAEEDIVDLSLEQEHEQLLIAQMEQQKQTVSVLEQEMHHTSIEHAQRQTAIDTLSQHINELEAQLSQKQQWQETQQTWLHEQNQDIQGLAECISVDKGWENAVEMVLGEAIKANVLTQSAATWPTTNSPSIVRLVKPSLSAIKADNVMTLADKVSCDLEASNTFDSLLMSLLSHVVIATDSEDAQKVLPGLLPHQSVICADGLWLGHHFFYKGSLDSEYGFLQQQDKLHQLKEELSQHQCAIEQILVKQQQQKDELTQTTITNAQNEQQLQTFQKNLANKRQQQALVQQKQQQLAQQALELTQAIDTLNLQIKDEQALLAEFKQTLIKQVNNDQVEDNHNRVSNNDDLVLEAQNKKLQTQVRQLQQLIDSLHQEKHALELSLEQSKQQYQFGQKNVERYHEAIAQLTEQQQINHQLLEENTAPFIEDEHQLQLWLAQLVTIEEKITHLHQQQLEIEQALEQHEQKQQQAIQHIETLKSELSQLHLDHESARLKAENARDQIVEMGQNFEDVKENIPQNAKESQWQAQLIRLGKDIGQLGPINLAAIDEYNTQLTRKNYLDQQDEDLNLAISTLESAITKIDRESRQKFKATFEQVNFDLQQLFPKVFGGGQAYLTLTGEDLLETGVTIMARPPGKKNSTIHLLSGGEKALTALSLVFAIFRLNPAPFCMLDEVDAPLDDANVGRFCNLVREMSQTVQFVYISHNKIAMEMANHLTGVTMFEAGVSRIVSVDIDEAIAMAEVS